MPSITTKEQLFLLVALLLPGYVVVAIRNLFVVRADSSGYREILEYIFGSAICGALGAPILNWLANGQLAFWGQYGCVLLLLLVIPVLVGLSWSYVATYELIEKIAPIVGLTAVHHINTAWDWKFGRMGTGEWVLVTMKDGSAHAGFVGSNSFIASGIQNRDIYIEQVYDLGPNDSWSHPGRRKSILIPYGEVQSIVFWADNMEADSIAED